MPKSKDKTKYEDKGRADLTADTAHDANNNAEDYPKAGFMSDGGVNTEVDDKIDVISNTDANAALSKLGDAKTADTTMLAYLGDAIYELAIRVRAAESAGPGVRAAELNHFTVGYVQADSQALAMKRLAQEDDDGTPLLTEEELRLVKRARNRTSTSVPRGSTPKAYKLATSLEALIGWLYVTGKDERLDMIIKKAVEAIDLEG